MGLRTLGLWLVALGVVAVCVACTTTNAGSTTGTGADGGSSSSTDEDGGSTVAPTDIACPDCLTSDQLAAFCNEYVVTCNQTSLTMAQCLSYYDLVRVSANCKAMLPTATCADLETAGSALLTACFPTCGAPSTNMCSVDGTYVTACDANGNTEVVDCARLCASDSATWDTTTKCGGSCFNMTGQPACCCSK